MSSKLYFTGFIVLISAWVLALQPPTSDSTIIAAPQKKTTPSLVMRAHSLGLFTYMGKVVNYHPAGDVFFSYTTNNGWGFSAFKVADLSDIHSHNNFAFGLINKTLHLGKRLSIAPSIGISLEQQHKFVDHGSDVLAMLTTTLRLNKNLVIDHNAMFNNLIFETHFSDWINRFRILYSKNHMDVTGLVWHNNALIDGTEYTSSGISFFYNRIRLTKKVWLGGGVTDLWAMTSSNTDIAPKRNGLQFTTSITLK